MTLSQDQRRQLSEKLSQVAKRHFAFLHKHGEAMYDLQWRSKMGPLTKEQNRQKAKLHQAAPVFAVERHDAILSVLTAEQKPLLLSRLLDDRIRQFTRKGRAAAEPEVRTRLEQERDDTVKWFLSRDDSPSVRELVSEFVRRTAEFVRRPRQRE